MGPVSVVYGLIRYNTFMSFENQKKPEAKKSVEKRSGLLKAFLNTNWWPPETLEKAREVLV